MSSICELSDDLLVKILSLVKTKDAVATSLVSKRWLNLWKLVPRLDYISPRDATGSDFINNFMLLSKAPVLETMHLNLGYKSAPEEHERWVNTAVSRHVRDLELLHYRCSYTPMPLPGSLFTCKSLVVLRLRQVKIYDVPSTLSFQFLKTLSLLCVTFSSRDKLVCRLLSACPILETLVISRFLEDRAITYTISVPSLQSLHIMERPSFDRIKDRREYIVNAPSLKTLKVFDKHSRFRSLAKMPKLVKAEIKTRQEHAMELLGCLTSAKHLTLCLTSEIQPVMSKSIENLPQLEYLELCTNCSSDWLSLLLRHSPKLRVLRLNQRNCGFSRFFEPQWEEPCCVPECLVSSLETVEWIGHRGTHKENKAAIYILEKARHLQKMTLSQNVTSLRKKYRTRIDLRLSLGCSCRHHLLEFVPLEQL